MSSVTPDAWDGLWSDLDSLKSAISRSSAVNVNSTSLRGRAQQVVQAYFRQVRPQLVSLGLSDEDLTAADGGMQRLLILSQGRNAKSSYVRALRDLSRERAPLTAQRERRFGATKMSQGNGPVKEGSIEHRIILTLQAMLPEAAASYEQALSDLQGQRISWRGTAVELREVVREVLDHLAPDEAVTREQGYKPEKDSKGKDRSGPTMRQKAGFVFRSRGLSASKRKAPQQAFALVDELTATFVRSIYERGSGSTHGAPTRPDIEKLKMYVEIALVELLETPHP